MIRNGRARVIGRVVAATAALGVALILVAGCGGSSSNDNNVGTGGSSDTSPAATTPRPVRATTPPTTTPRATTPPSTACPAGDSTQIDFTANPPKVVGCGPALPPPPSTIAPAPSSGLQVPVNTHDVAGNQFQTAKQDGYIP